MQQRWDDPVRVGTNAPTPIRPALARSLDAVRPQQGLHGLVEVRVGVPCDIRTCGDAGGRAPRRVGQRLQHGAGQGGLDIRDARRCAAHALAWMSWALWNVGVTGVGRGGQHQGSLDGRGSARPMGSYQAHRSWAPRSGHEARTRQGAPFCIIMPCGGGYAVRPALILLSDYGGWGCRSLPERRVRQGMPQSW